MITVFPGDNSSTGDPGRFKQLITVTTAESPYSYTPSAGVRAIKVTLVGGGGGSGGCALTGAGQAATSGGGGGGGAAIKWIDVSTLAWPQTITIGTGGAGGNAGANNGSNGGTTSFGAVFTATGGSFGFASAAVTNAIATAGAGGTSTTGDIKLLGSDGFFGLTVGGASLRTGSGGASPFAGAQRQTNDNANGTVGKFPGGGAGGASNNQNQAAKAGGDGADGVCWIEEFE